MSLFKKIINLYGLEDEAPTLLYLSYFEEDAFEDAIKSGHLKGNLEYNNDGSRLIDLTVTDDPKKVRTFISGLDFFKDTDDIGFYVRVKSGK